MAWEALQNLIDRSSRIVFFGGAGVSTESGVPDFRSTDGLYHQQFRYPPETILSHSFFMAHTEEFYDFYREKLLIENAFPNPAHRKLAELERAGKMTGVVTQNIDGLHTLAGSERVFELHGSVHRNYCMRCGRFYPRAYIAETVGVPRCSCGGIVKPDVVLYEEPLNDRVVAGAVDAIRRADLMIIGGTSLAVYPAAGLIRCFGGQDLVLINRDPTGADDEASLIIREPIGQVLGSMRIE